MKRYATSAFLMLVMAWLTPSAIAQQNDSQWFDFCPPWDDATPGSIIDMSKYNTAPAGSNGWIITKGSSFIESNTGKRIRFLATNTTAWHCFPEKKDAQAVAGRMAKFGINMVRLHHMDNRWSIDGGSSIWKLDPKGALVIDEKQLDKLDYFIAQLKKNGIYVNLNLKVSKSLSAADGFPESIKDITFGYHKKVDKYNEKMIEHQKAYARQMLKHVNPYTGLEYRNDPAMAIVEINNENGLLGGSWGGIGKGFEKIPEPFLGELKAKWNKWLTNTYSSDHALRSAWASDMPVQTTPVLPSNGKWILGAQSGAKGALQYPDGQSNGIQSPMHIRIDKHTGMSWHLELHLPNLDVKDGYGYTLTFKAKAAKSRHMTVAVMRDTGDYRSVGLQTNVKIGTQWDEYSYAFQGNKVDPDHTRLTFKVGGAVDDIWIDNIKITTGMQSVGLLEDESLARANIHIPSTSSKKQHQDWIRFLVDVEAKFSAGMRDLLKKELGVKAMVIDGQIDWGGMTGYQRESIMDFADVHAYWQHPNFPGRPWDRGNWTVGNKSLVNTWAAGDHGTLDRMTIKRLIDRPFTVSEYDHPAPNEYAAECIPLLAAVAATQDWDGVYSFEYGPWNHAKEQNRISIFFDHGSHPGKITFYPAAAMLFRQGLLAPLQSTVTLNLPKQAYDQYETQGNAWEAVDYKLTPSTALTKQHGMHMDQLPAGQKATLTHAGETSHADSQLQIRKVDGGGIFIAESDKAQVAVGMIGDKSVELSKISLNFKAFEKNFGAITLTAMDEKTIASSKSMLLTVVTQTRNQNMKWNKAHNSVGYNVGNGSTQVLGVTGDVSIQCNAAKKVYALDQTGQRSMEVPVTYSTGKLTFTINPNHKTVWYEITTK